MSLKPRIKILENSGTLVAVSMPLGNKVAYQLGLLVVSDRDATHITKVTNGPSIQEEEVVSGCPGPTTQTAPPKGCSDLISRFFPLAASSFPFCLYRSQGKNLIGYFVSCNSSTAR